MGWNELKENYVNGNLKDVAYEVRHNFGWFDFASAVEDDYEMSDSDKVRMLTRILKIAF